MGFPMRILLLSAALLGFAGTAAGQPAYFSAVGYTDLQARLGAATPTGAGIQVAQIEAQFQPLITPNQYLPGTPATDGKNLTDMSGGGLVSSHATDVGRIFYGDQSMAPGITDVNAYRVDGTLTAGDWYGPAYLNVGSANPPQVSAARVHNFSWVGTSATPDAPFFTEGLRRLDFAVKRDNIVAVVSVNNGGSTPIPALLANGYNTIAVGLTNGNSSIGPTTADTVGRSKPDIVAPEGATSYAAPMVSAAAALLLETADAKADAGEALRAGRVETIKAALLSGATKDEFAALATPWTRDTVTVGIDTFQRPLDARFGAGELNINNSHLILSAAEQNGADSAVDSRYGWDHEQLSGSDVRRYYLDIPTGATDVSITATANWLRTFDASGNPTMSEVHLKLFEADSSFALGSLIDESVSPIDNVQHLYATGLGSGRRYAIEVTLVSLALDQSFENVAVAWRAEFTPAPEPGAVLAFVAIAITGLARLRRK